MTNNISIPIAVHRTPHPTAFHLSFLDGIRGVAAIYVMLHHTWLTVYFDQRHPSRVVAFWGSWLNYGHFAVDLFIVLSGFCLMIPIVRNFGVLKNGTLNFFNRSALRILPPYYAALATSLVFATTILSHKIGTIWDYSLPVTRMGIVAHLFLLQDIHRSLEINSVFWSIAVECQIYLLFPLLIFVWKRVGWYRAAALVIAMSLTASFLLQHTRLVGLTAHYLALFTLGMVGAEVSFSHQPKLAHYRELLPWKGISTALFVLLILACTLLPGQLSQNMRYVDLLVGLCSASFLVAMSKGQMNLPYRFLNWKPLVTIGTFSYSLYLIHLPLLQILWQFILMPLPVTNLAKLLLLCLVGSSLVILCSYIFFWAFERPLINKRRIESLAE